MGFTGQYHDRAPDKRAELNKAPSISSEDRFGSKRAQGYCVRCRSEPTFHKSSMAAVCQEPTSVAAFGKIECNHKRRAL